MSVVARSAGDGRTFGWFAAQILHTGRLPLFCFFVAFLVSFAVIRLSVRMIRAQVRWWPGNVTPGNMHLHHMVFGVIFMVLDEFALILHLRDVYWTSAGRVSIDAVFIAAALTALLLLGVTPTGVGDVAGYLSVPGGTEALVSLILSTVVLFAFAAITLLKGKLWTGLFGLFLPFLFLIGAFRLARPQSPWSRWRYQRKPKKLARSSRREERLREPVIRVKTRIVDLVAGYHDPPARSPERHEK